MNASQKNDIIIVLNVGINFIDATPLCFLALNFTLPLQAGGLVAAASDTWLS